MHVVVAGGNLQGVEAAYLARKAGWEVTVIDRHADVAAAGLGDRFVQMDITENPELGKVADQIDLIVPALENQAALEALVRGRRKTGVPLAFCPEAYAISSSKQKSDRLFAELGLPAPRPWPASGLPVVVKPSVGSGSRGVRFVHDAQRLKKIIEESSEPLVVQEFLTGPSYSIEVMGVSGQYLPLVVTDLALDSGYDCKRVTAPTDLVETGLADFKALALALARALKLTGIMDLECVLHQGALKLLEIDARLPSQTPTAVYWAQGLNMVQMLEDIFVHERLPRFPENPPSRGVVYEHIRVTPGRLETGGEHLMSGQGPLDLKKDFLGADEALTNQAPGRSSWVATLIVSEGDRRSALEKRNRVIADIRRHFHLEAYLDESPGEHPWEGGW